MSSNPRFAVAAFVLVAAAVFLRANSRKETLPPHLPMASFPSHVEGWNGSDLIIPKDSLAVLGGGDFMLRDYQNESAGIPDVGLFLAFFPSQRAGDTAHSPKNCLPGSGWYPLESRRIAVSAPGHAPFPANRYVIAKGTERELVLYWYWAHDRGVASEYSAKFYLVKDSIEMHRSDGALVRLTTEMGSGETADKAQERLLAFSGKIVPLLNQYIPK